MGRQIPPRGDILNELQIEILRIIKRALADDFDEEINLNTAWDIIFKAGKEHKIIPILCEGLLNTNLDGRIKKVFLDEYKRQALAHFSQIDKLEAVTNAFDKNNIDYMLLKGTRLKALYPKPEMRVMVDLDILIKLEQYEKIKQCMTDLGLFEEYESDHEFIWSDKRLVHIELHKRLFPSYNPDFCRYFGIGWERAKNHDPQKSSFELSPEDEYIFIFTHFAKHYRDGGIGIRHMLDLYLFAMHNPQMDSKYIESQLRELQLFDFYKNVRHTLEVWFEGAEVSITDTLITNKIFGSGAYGTRESLDAAKALRVTNRSKTTLGGRFRFILKSAFPSVSVAKDSFPILKRIPVLLPAVWILRLVKSVIFKKNALKNVLSQAKSINDETVSSYREELKSVGLGNEF